MGVFGLEGGYALIFVSRIRLLQAGVRGGLWGNMRIGELVGGDDLQIGCNNMLSFNYRF